MLDRCYYSVLTDLTVEFEWLYAVQVVGHLFSMISMKEIYWGKKPNLSEQHLQAQKSALCTSYI